MDARLRPPNISKILFIIMNVHCVSTGRAYCISHDDMTTKSCLEISGNPSHMIFLAPSQFWAKSPPMDLSMLSVGRRRIHPTDNYYESVTY